MKLLSAFLLAQRRSIHPSTSDASASWKRPSIRSRPTVRDSAAITVSLMTRLTSMRRIRSPASARAMPDSLASDFTRSARIPILDAIWHEKNPCAARFRMASTRCSFDFGRPSAPLPVAAVLVSLAMVLTCSRVSPILDAI